MTLAVRFGDSVTAPNVTSLSAEDDGLDEFLSSHGFEFIEGDRDERRPTQDVERHSDDEDSGQGFHDHTYLHELPLTLVD